eukprot:7203367-Pyramimonas_sp.AAC.1
MPSALQGAIRETSCTPRPNSSSSSITKSSTRYYSSSFSASALREALQVTRLSSPLTLLGKLYESLF